jgi:hypothetical protein
MYYFNQELLSLQELVLVPVNGDLGQIIYES